jgi:hypothetical protein
MKEIKINKGDKVIDITILNPDDSQYEVSDIYNNGKCRVKRLTLIEGIIYFNEIHIEGLKRL